MVNKKSQHDERKCLLDHFWFGLPLVLLLLGLMPIYLLPANTSSSATKQQGGGILKGDVPLQEDKGQYHVTTNLNCNKEQLWMSPRNIYCMIAYVTQSVCSIWSFSFAQNCLFHFSCNLLHKHDTVFETYGMTLSCHDWYLSNGLLLLYLDSKLISISFL